jgi:hypothetical protein
MARPAIVIGLGGTGQWILTYLKKNLLESHYGSVPDNVRLVAFDTMPTPEAETAQARAEEEKEIRAGAVRLEEHIEFIPLTKNARDTGQHVSEGRHTHIGSWFPASFYLQAAPPAIWDLATGAGQVRQFGRLAFFEKVSDTIWPKLQQAIQRVQGQVGRDRELEIIIIASFAGGTGAGMFVDTAILARQVARPLVAQNMVVRGLFVLPRVFGVAEPGPRTNRMLARSFAAWRELDRFMIMGTGWGTRRLVYRPGVRDLEIDLRERPFDVCYLVDAVRDQNALDDVEPEYGVFPAVADFIGAILDDRGGTFYSHYVTTNLVPAFLARPDEPQFSALGTYAIKVPIYYTLQMHTHQFARDLLDLLLRPVKDDQGRVTELSAGHNLEAGAGKSGREAALGFLQVQSVTLEAVGHQRDDEGDKETLYNTIFPGQVASIFRQEGLTNAQLVRQLAMGGLSRVRRGQRAEAGWIGALTHLGEDAAAQKVVRDIEQELKLQLRSEVPPSKELKDPPPEAVFRLKEKVPQFRQRHYGTQLASGIMTRGTYGEALDRCREFQVLRFGGLLRLWILNTLNGATEDPVVARSGKLGYVHDFSEQLVEILDYFLRFLAKVREEREGLGIDRDLKARVDSSWRALQANAHRKLLFFFTHPRAHSTQEQYLRAEQTQIDARKDELLLDAIRQTAEEMRDVARHARDAAEEWTIHLATGDPPRDIQGLYGTVERRLREVAATYEEDKQAQKVHQLLGDVEYERNDEALKEELARFSWDVQIKGDKVSLDCLLTTPAGEVQQLSTRKGIALDRNLRAILELGEGQYRELPRERTAGSSILEQFPRYQDLGDEVLGRGEPLLKLGSQPREPERKSYFVSVQHSDDPDLQVYFTDLREWLLARTNIAPENVAVFDSEDEHKCTFVRTDDMISGNDFQMWQVCQEAYLDQIQRSTDPQEGPRLHVFPAEANAAEFERQVPRVLRTSSYRIFHPKVVMLLENKKRASLFFRCWAYGLITQHEDESNLKTYRLTPPEADPLMLTEPSDAWPDVFHVLDAFSLVGRDALIPEHRINFEDLERAVLGRERELGSEGTVERLEQEIEQGLVSRLRSEGEDRMRQRPPDESLRWRDGQDYLDLADVAELVLRDIIEDQRSRL